MDYIHKHVKTTDSHLSAESPGILPVFFIQQQYLLTTGMFILGAMGPAWINTHANLVREADMGDGRVKIILLFHLLAELTLVEQGRRRCPLPASTVQPWSVCC